MTATQIQLDLTSSSLSLWATARICKRITVGERAPCITHEVGVKWGDGAQHLAALLLLSQETADSGSSQQQPLCYLPPSKHACIFFSPGSGKLQVSTSLWSSDKSWILISCTCAPAQIPNTAINKEISLKKNTHTNERDSKKVTFLFY